MNWSIDLQEDVGGGAVPMRRASTPAAQRRRRAAILEAAKGVFLSAGYRDASMDEVAKRAGTSKATLYLYFDAKEALFGALIGELSACAMVPPAALDPQLAGAHALLEHVGRQYLDTLLSPTVLALYRSVISEAIRFPDVAAAFHEQGPARARAALCRLLRQLVETGEIETADCDRAAALFLSMLREDMHFQVLLQLRCSPTAEERQLMVERAVDVLLGGRLRLKARSTAGGMAGGARTLSTEAVRHA